MDLEEAKKRMAEYHTKEFIEKKLAEFQATLKPLEVKKATDKPSGIEKPTQGQLAKAKAQKDAKEKAKKEEYEKISKLKGKKLIEGVGAAPGICIGIVRNVRDGKPELMIEVKSGDIIVADRLEPEHEIFFDGVMGVVTNSGGITSNAAFIALKRGIPAVTGTIGISGEAATSFLNDGQTVIIDGFSGYADARDKYGKNYKKKIGAVYECIQC